MTPIPSNATCATPLGRAVSAWLPPAAAATCLVLLIYAIGQQTLRSSANDVPIALALSTSARLDAGAPLAEVVPSPSRVDLAQSLEPFVLIFGPNGNLLAASATLHAAQPAYPVGVFATVTARGEDRVTWQPEPGVRAATVARPWRGGFVVAGQSLLLTEQHIDMVGQFCMVGWLAMQVVVAVAAFLASLLRRTRIPGRLAELPPRRTQPRGRFDRVHE